MNNMQYPIPVSVPKSTTSDTTATGAGGAASNDVSASVVSDSSKLDQGTEPPERRHWKYRQYGHARQCGYAKYRSTNCRASFESRC